MQREEKASLQTQLTMQRHREKDIQSKRKGTEKTPLDPTGFQIPSPWVFYKLLLKCSNIFIFFTDQTSMNGLMRSTSNQI